MSVVTGSVRNLACLINGSSPPSDQLPSTVLSTVVEDFLMHSTTTSISSHSATHDTITKTITTLIHTDAPTICNTICQTLPSLLHPATSPSSSHNTTTSLTVPHAKSFYVFFIHLVSCVNPATGKTTYHPVEFNLKLTTERTTMSAAPTSPTTSTTTSVPPTALLIMAITSLTIADWEAAYAADPATVPFDRIAALRQTASKKYNATPTPVTCECGVSECRSV